MKTVSHVLHTCLQHAKPALWIHEKACEKSTRYKRKILQQSIKQENSPKSSFIMRLYIVCLCLASSLNESLRTCLSMFLLSWNRCIPHEMAFWFIPRSHNIGHQCSFGYNSQKSSWRNSIFNGLRKGSNYKHVFQNILVYAKLKALHILSSIITKVSKIKMAPTLFRDCSPRTKSILLLRLLIQGRHPLLNKHLLKNSERIL